MNGMSAPVGWTYVRLEEPVDPTSLSDAIVRSDTVVSTDNTVPLLRKYGPGRFYGDRVDFRQEALRPDSSK